MARPVPFLPTHKIPCLSLSATSFFILIGVLSVFSIVSFLCGSRRGRSVRLGEKKPFSKLQSNISSKALLMVKMISWKKVRDDDDEEEETDDEEAVWRRTIIMGEKCRPLDFSGKILYDCHGNLLPSSPKEKSHGENKP
ncbi:hypothetical protein NMG60_11028652 [Bertholletia excelsa]